MVIGKDIRARKLSLLARKYEIPHISIVFDPGIVREKQKNNDLVIYGDALNEPVLQQAYIKEAAMVVVSVGDIIAASGIVEKVRNINTNAPIFARVKYISDMEELYKQGASHVVPEKFETVIELFNQVLMKRLIPGKDITAIIGSIRKDHYGAFFEHGHKNDAAVFFEALPDFEIKAYKVEEGSSVVHMSLKEIRLRKVFGVTLLAIRRNNEIIEHPGSDVIFLPDDCVYLLGRAGQLSKARELVTNHADGASKG